MPTAKLWRSAAHSSCSDTNCSNANMLKCWLFNQNQSIQNKTWWHNSFRAHCAHSPKACHPLLKPKPGWQAANDGWRGLNGNAGIPSCRCFSDLVCILIKLLRGEFFEGLGPLHSPLSQCRDHVCMYDLMDFLVARFVVLRLCGWGAHAPWGFISKGLSITCLGPPSQNMPLWLLTIPAPGFGCSNL